MAIKWDFNAKEYGAACLTKRENNKLIKINLTKLGENWYENFMPKHFLPNASATYGWRKRTNYYIEHVKRHFPNWQPALRTGEMAEAMASGNTKQINTAGENMTLKVKMKRGHPTLGYVSQEMTKVNQNELVPLLEQFKDDYIKDVQKIDPGAQNV